MGQRIPTRRRTVRELLAHAKDVAELMIDLAYASVFYGEEALAREVRRLEASLAGDLEELREVSMLAARTPEDAAGMSGVLALAGAIENIADAAEDIATITLRRLGVPQELRNDLRHAAEVVSRVKVGEGSALDGRALCDVELASHTGMWAIAIRRGDEYQFGPEGDFVVHGGDALLLQGPEAGVAKVRDLAGQTGADGPPEESTGAALTNLDRAVDLCVELKNASETAVGLAYSTILLGDRNLAAQVAVIESRTDQLWDELERWALEAAADADQPVQLRGLFHMAAASERIADAARDMTRLVEGDEPPHPIIASALGETDEIIADAIVGTGSAADGATLASLAFHTTTGMEVLAIERTDRWIYRPVRSQALRADDRLLVLGPHEGLTALRERCGDERPVEETSLRSESDEDE
ncbi:MAG: potassium channel family protein [Acidimicrobiia bacterium]